MLLFSALAYGKISKVEKGDFLKVRVPPFLFILTFITIMSFPQKPQLGSITFYPSFYNNFYFALYTLTENPFNFPPGTVFLGRQSPPARNFSPHFLARACGKSLVVFRLAPLFMRRKRSPLSSRAGALSVSPPTDSYTAASCNPPSRRKCDFAAIWHAHRQKRCCSRHCAAHTCKYHNPPRACLRNSAPCAH